MFRLRSSIVAILLSSSLSALSQSHDFIIQDFRENAFDLTAATSDIIDLRGWKPALIRFAVRDTLFSFTANNGILRIKKGVGEILLFVPDGTKRITVRHPYLGTLRDYVLPLPIKSKTTYDAEIVIQKEEKPAQSEKPIEEIVERRPVLNDEPLTWVVPTEYPTKSPTPIKTSFLLGGGYQALGVAGPTAQIGLDIGYFHISADYTFGLEKVEGVAIYYDNSFGEAYDYSVSRFSARLGLNTSPNSAFQVVPQIGASFNMIKGDEIVKKSVSEDQFSKSTPISLSVALSMRIRLAKPLYLYVTPQYDFVVAPDDAYKVIKEADSKIKGWGEGFCISAGLLLRF